MVELERLHFHERGEKNLETITMLSSARKRKTACKSEQPEQIPTSVLTRASKRTRANEDRTASVRDAGAGEKPFKCGYPGCRYASATKSTLTVHERTHSGEKPFKCGYPGCRYASATKSNLTVHERTHSGEKPFKYS